MNNKLDLSNKSLRIGQQCKCINNHKDRKCNYNLSMMYI